MKSIGAHPRAAALIGLILALPLSFLFPVAFYEIEPFNSFFKPLLTEADGVRQNTLSKIVFIGGMLLLPVASIIALAPVLRSVRAGAGFGANPVNLSLGIVIMFLFVRIVGGIFIDQLPCFLGVPNCD